MRTKRKREVYEIIPNAGGQYTYVGGVSKIIEILKAFSHAEYNLPAYKVENSIFELVKTGKDLFWGEMEFEFVSEDYNLPKYLKMDEGYNEFYKLFIDKKMFLIFRYRSIECFFNILLNNVLNTKL
jgi:beta-1,4-mannosyl-glycoprotein beta-1,4-N-acetylglucosaminyltransferase